MSRALLGCLVLVAGCRIELDQPFETPACVVSTVVACTAADSYQDFESIDLNILNKNCTGSSCHEKSSSSAKARRLVFDQGKDPNTNHYDTAYKTLVYDVNRLPTMDDPYVQDGHILSDVETAEAIPLVAANQPDRSYLLFAMHGITPADFQFHVASPPSVGFMPYGGSTLCCQKIDAIQRWIVAGAPNDIAP